MTEPPSPQADPRALAAGAGLAQALGFAGLLTSVTAGGHLMAGGSIGGFGWLAGVFVVALAARCMLGRCRCAWPALAALGLALQLGGHLALSQHGAGGPALVPACGGLMPSLLPLPPGDPGLLHGWPMMVAHVLAALLTAWWLRSGERAADTLRAWVRAHVEVLDVPRPVGPGWARPVTRIAVRRLWSQAWRPVAASRAPPLAWT